MTVFNGLAVACERLYRLALFVAGFLSLFAERETLRRGSI